MKYFRCVKQYISLLLIIMFVITSINIMAFSSNDKNINNKNSEKTARSRSRVSKNPVLWLENYDEGIAIIRAPKKVGSENITLDAADMVIYDITNKRVSQESRQNYESNAVASISPFSGCRGIEQSDFIPENVIPPDDRVRIEDTTAYPYSSICKLIIYAPNGYVYIGTGFLVGSADGHGYHVLTAGHCVYGPEMGGWATAIRVFPALNGAYAPFWHAWATTVRTYSYWVDDQAPEFDWALITIDRNVGDYTGWMGLRTFDYTNPVYTGLLETAGYPGDLDSGYGMYWDSDFGILATEYNHWYFMDTYGGQSGSPVWYDDSGPYVLSIHAYGGGGTDPNMGTRLTSGKLSDVVGWCSLDTAPADYANLIDDGEDYSGFSPVSVVSGETSFTAWSSERNIGTGDSGGYYVSYYASSDTEITGSDYLIGSVYVDGVSPFTYHDSEWTGVFPTGIPDGDYWVGWIIDSQDDVSELIDDGENDNMAYETGYQISIGSPSNSAPSVVWVKAIGPDGRLDPGGEVQTGDGVNLRTRVSDPETPAADLTVTISYRPQGGTWTTETTSYNPVWDYWYYRWDIPGDAEPGLYDVKVDVEDPDEGSTTSTELGEFTLI